MKTTPLIAILCLVVGSSVTVAQGPLGKAFTYQGQLKTDGIPADGSYDLQFRLWNHPTETVPGTNVAGPICLDNVTVEHGLFSVSVDFGTASALFSGGARWLEVGVRADTAMGNCGSGTYQVLSSRQAITAAPYASGLTMPTDLVNGSSGNAVKIIQKANTGRNPGNSGALLIDNSGNKQVGLQLYTNAELDPNALNESERGYAPILVELANPAANVPAIEIHHLGTAGFTPAMLIRAPSPQIEMYESDQAAPFGKFEIQVQGDIFLFNGRNDSNNSFDNVVWMLRPAPGFGGNVGIGANPYQIEKLTIGGCTSGINAESCPPDEPNCDRCVGRNQNFPDTGGPPRIALKETTSPTATLGYGKLYVKSSDSRLYFMNDSGVESPLTLNVSTTEKVEALHQELKAQSTLVNEAMRAKDQQIEELERRIRQLEEKMKP